MGLWRHNGKLSKVCTGGACCPIMVRMARCWRRTMQTLSAPSALLASIAVVAFGQQLWAQSKVGNTATVLHERLPSAARGARSDTLVRSKSGALNAIDTAAGRIEKPERPGRNAPQAPLYEVESSDKSTIGSDRQTGGEGTLHYRAVFNPTVAPFKRDRVFDQVTASGQLKQSGAGLRAIRPKGKMDRSGHELFWGHITVELKAGKRTTIPSVAPNAELVHADSSPSRTLTFYRDIAGNLSVSAKRKGTVTLRYLLDAPSTYFAAPIGAGAVYDDPFKPRLGAAIQRRMQQLWPALGVAPSHSRKVNVEKLVEHFRSFEPGLLDGVPGGDLLVDLIVARKGVCRHRAHAFVVMAHSLAIPAHYVINDAHAFVEVWVAGLDGRGRWQRVDLGGGAETLRLHGADQKHLHDPLFRDSLPRPQVYDEGVSNVTGDGRLNASSWAGADKVVGAHGLVGRGGGSRPGGQSAASDVGKKQPRAPAKSLKSAANQAPKSAQWLHERAIERARIARNVAAPKRPPSRTSAPAASTQLATSLRLTHVVPVAYIGETVQLRGTLVLADGKKAGVLPVEVWLVQPRDPTKGIYLGTVLTGADGGFATNVAVPMSARLGEHDVVVYFPGRGKLRSSYSRD